MWFKSRKSKEKFDKDKKWSREVRARDQHMCRYCGRSDTDLQASHIVPRHYLLTKWDLNNGLLLCSSNGCRTHDMYDGRYGSKDKGVERVQKIVGLHVYKGLWDKARRLNTNQWGYKN